MIKTKNRNSFLRLITTPKVKNSTSEIALESENFNIMLFILVLLSIILNLSNFALGLSLLLEIFTLCSTLFLVILYYLSKFKNWHNIILTCVVLCLILSFSWFMNGGLIGSTGYLYITAMFILIIIGRLNQIKKIVLILGINIILLLFLEYVFGDELIVKYPNKTSQYQDIIIVYLIVFISIYYLARFVKNSSENEKKVVKGKNIIIEKKNKELLDSLTYAALIQKRIMSDESKLQHLFNDSFVLFKPKDIVSGDFYFVKETGKYNIVIVADCTGHGAPAAFLSIMGITLLQKLIKKNSNDLDTSILLDKLRKRLKIYLERNNHSGVRLRDGMDLGICIFNYETYTLQYSGAYRPLIMIRENGLIEPENFDSKISNQTHTLYSFTPTKNTIGFNYKTLPFENHYIKFFTGDTFYLFSDGYADQFDLENRKKFNLKRFKDELLNTCHLSLTNQGVCLDQLHKNWKGGTEQTDDIILLGIRI